MYLIFSVFQLERRKTFLLISDFWPLLGSQTATFSFKSFTTCSASMHMLFRKIINQSPIIP